MFSRGLVFAGATCAVAIVAAGMPGWAQQLSSLPQNTTSVSELRTLCAARDLALITKLEERGPSASSAVLSSAFTEMVKARGACIEGRSAEALSMYDTVLTQLAAD